MNATRKKIPITVVKKEEAPAEEESALQDLLATYEKRDGVHPGGQRADPRGPKGAGKGGMMRARPGTSSVTGGKGRTPIMPHATGSTVPRVQDPSKSKVKQEGGAPSNPRPQGLQAKTDMERAQEVLDDNDGQTHPPIRVPLAQSQRLYLQEEVMLDVKKPPAEQLGVEDRRAAAEDAKRALTLFEENMDDKEADKLFFVQLPSALPISSMLQREDVAPAQGDANATDGPHAPPEEAGLHQQTEWEGKLGDVRPLLSTRPAPP